METLPDELLLLVAGHLGKIEILYAFYNLNRRFQRIVHSCLSDIDLSREHYVPYKQFAFFINQFIPLHSDFIRVLTLTDQCHLELLQPHVCQLVNLESLTLKRDLRQVSNQMVAFLIKALSLPTLTELSISECDGETFRTIVSHASQNLTALTILGLHAQDDYTSSYTLPSLKRFILETWYIKLLENMFKIMTNLEELNLSILSDLKDLLQPPPRTLKRLHLEFEHSYRRDVTKLKHFLTVFQDILQSFTLIIIDANKQYANYDQLHSLVTNFTCLQTFEYHIRIAYQPDLAIFSNVEQVSHSIYPFSQICTPQSVSEMRFSPTPVQRSFSIVMCLLSIWKILLEKNYLNNGYPRTMISNL